MTKKRYFKVELGNESSGVSVERDAVTDIIRLTAYFDHMVSIEGGTMTTDEFLRQLGIRFLLNRDRTKISLAVMWDELHI